MADKKVSTLTERVTEVIGADLLMIVGNTATTPANYRVQVKNFLSKLQVDLAANSAVSGFKIAANVVANASVVQSVAEFRLNSGNTSIAGTKSYGVVINHTVANTSSGVAVAPIAFWGIQEAAGTNGLPTKYLFDLGLAGTANVSANVAAPNSTVILTVANGTTVAAANSIPATHEIRCHINGADYWLLASNVAPA